jgi:hypothetical protein
MISCRNTPKISALILCVVSGMTIPLRHSPDVSELIVSSLRSAVVLPANRLAQKPGTVCDSLIEGPFCVIVSSRKRPTTGGLIDTALWGEEMSQRTYERNYRLISDFAQLHWTGSIMKVPRKPRISNLIMGTAGSSFRFAINPFAAEQAGFSPNEWTYILNSIHGYLSFPNQVSVIEMVIKAPQNSNVLVRAFSDGVPVWSRLVQAGQTEDVARPCKDVDPSVESIDHLEVIAVGAELVALAVSTSSEVSSKTYVFIDSDPANPSRYSGVRTFPPSAYLIDMETAASEGLYFLDPWENQAPAKSALYENLFSSNTLVNILEHSESDTEIPIPQLDYFIHLIDRRASESESFESEFIHLLVEGSVELIAYILKRTVAPPITESDADSRARQFAARIRVIRGDDHFSSAAPVKIVNLHAVSPILVEAANTVALALFAHLGRDKFEEIVLRNKLVRMTNSEDVSTEGLDEPALLAVIVEGLGLPFDDQTPETNRRSILSRIIEILLDGSPVANAGNDLVNHLFP